LNVNFVNYIESVI